MIAKTMTIAGSDSGGGAGIQADIKTFQELDVYGTSVITAITAQNTLGVHSVYPLPLSIVQEQIDAVLSDIGADAVKTGMLYSSELIELVAANIKRYNIEQLIVDPVMVAKGGTPLLQKEAVKSLCNTLLPLASIVTPNIPEALIISNLDKIETITHMKEACRHIHALGPRTVLLKGGHLANETAIDLLFDGQYYEAFESERIETTHTHGTGCTLAAAITANIAKKQSLIEAVHFAKQFVTAGIAKGMSDVGGGIGPVNHFAWRHRK